MHKCSKGTKRKQPKNGELSNDNLLIKNENIVKNYIYQDDDVLKMLEEQLKKAEKDYVNNNDITLNIDYLRCDKLTNKYTNKELQKYIYNCFVKFKRYPKINATLQPYTANYMYIFVTTITDPERKKRLIIKIGFTQNLDERKKYIESQIKCKIYLLGYRIINGLADETSLQKFLREKYKILHCPLFKKLNNEENESELTEFYYLNSIIMEEYSKYNIYQPNVLEIEKEKTKQKELDLKKIIQEIELVKLQIELAKINQSK